MINNNKVEEVRKELNRDLDLGLALSKAEGNLNFCLLYTSDAAAILRV